MNQEYKRFMGVKMIINIIIVILLGISSYTDIKNRKISMRLLLVFGILAILVWIEKLYTNGIIEVCTILVSILPGLLLLLLGKATRESIGYGDGYLLIVIGIYIGFIRTVSILITALFLTAIISIFLLIFRKVSRRTEFPFIPMLLISYLIKFIM